MSRDISIVFVSVLFCGHYSILEGRCRVARLPLDVRKKKSFTLMLKAYLNIITCIGWSLTYVYSQWSCGLVVMDVPQQRVVLFFFS